MTRKPLSNKHRFEILCRDSFTCQYCGAKPPDARLHVDHAIPVALGGTNHEANLVTACQTCNNGKRDGLIRPVVVQEWLFKPMGFDFSEANGLILVVAAEDMDAHLSVPKISLLNYVASGRGRLVPRIFGRTGHKILEPGRDRVLKVPISQWLSSNDIDVTFGDDDGIALNPVLALENILYRCAEFSLANTNSKILDAADIGQGLLSFLSPGPDYALTYAEAKA